MSRGKNKTSTRHIALCYIRQSYTRDGEDTNSPDRQRANIEQLVANRGWIPEWYEDVGGHRSGRSEHSRPQWLALKKRLDDPDVVAVVANDMSRLHRKGWRIGRLIETINEHDIALVFAAPGRELDTSGITGRMTAQFIAMMDEAYAEDIAQRAKDSISYRKKQGITVGIPPFGTIRDDNGFLCPSPDGYWYMPNGAFLSGNPDNPPSDSALWRTYYECAKYALKIYSTGDMGLDKLAYKLSAEGWAFRNRKGYPRPINRTDVRRIISNWQEYGGIVTDQRAKDRPAYEEGDLDNIPFIADRAIMPIELLRKVAKIRQERTIRPRDMSLTRKARVYPLSTITYCAHCERLAKKHKDLSQRSALSGFTGKDGIVRYRHQAGVNCGVINRSVHSDIYEEDFARLITLFDIDREQLDPMVEMAIELDKALGIYHDSGDLEEKKRETIALCRRRIDATITLYGDGLINRDEYRRRIEENEQIIAYWEAKTTEIEKIATEFKMCLDVVNYMAELWDHSTLEDRKGMAQNLFEYVVFDLDTQQITEFQLKPWGDRFLILTQKLYEVDDPETKITASNMFQGSYNGIPPRGLDAIPCCEATNSLSLVLSAA